MSDKTYNVLFICTGNSARSILGEALMNHLGAHRFKAWSAGSRPVGQVNPQALAQLERWHVPTEGLNSKRWDDFAQPGAPVFDFIFTVCDNAAGETCPVWPGQPMTAHWGVPDPAAVKGDAAAVEKAFLDAAVTLRRRIELLLALPLAKLDQLAIRHEITTIGKA